ncbi:MAG: GHKL domain-containing protein [Winogradskyella sp.]|uniref:sensor histidine kinase n=1 Tax=Winogradskyella sp. TaxID=1883156 RepID=UPI0025DC4D51|nr:ATP-binding protein [Winogradskyella sp.]NRB60284.1 GHKL domain-containing protein [Winogradskyella sp.]
MKIENHILTILQLYEYAMAIGKSLDYNESCNNFIRLILKRKNLNAAWILSNENNKYVCKYSIPFGRKSIVKTQPDLNNLLHGIDSFELFNNNALALSTAPIKLKDGHLAVFNLKEEGYLFLYSKKNNIDAQDLSKLQPVISKFMNALKACRVFSDQQRLLKNLEKQNQELSDYAHMVSHDLKSPLRSIDALTSWITEDYYDHFDVEGKNQLNEIRFSVNKMDAMIKGILDYSTIDKNQSETYDVDLYTLVKETVSCMSVPENISVMIDELPKVRGDKFRLQQLFQNLVDNAIKYNDKEQGLVNISVVDNNQFWKFYVSDNGKGIDSKYFDKIFQTFGKLENRKDSTGIGLAVVKKIVHMYEGSIWVESTLGLGTTFFFTLRK